MSRSAKLALATIWTLAVGCLAGSAVAVITYGVRSSEMMGPMVFDRGAFAAVQLIGQLFEPLLFAGLVCGILALTVHAALWRRARLRKPAPSR